MDPLTISDEIVPIVPVKQMRGFLRGIDTDVKRDGDRPLWTQDADFAHIEGVRYVAKHGSEG
jgi:hypothetical protein